MNELLPLINYYTATRMTEMMNLVAGSLSTPSLEGVFADIMLAITDRLENNGGEEDGDVALLEGVLVTVVNELAERVQMNGDELDEESSKALARRITDAAVRNGHLFE